MGQPLHHSINNKSGKMNIPENNYVNIVLQIPVYSRKVRWSQ